MTGAELIALALRTSGALGVGQTALAQDSADALTLLNGLLASWTRKRWLVPSLRDVSFTSTGAASYTIGPSGDFAIPRPDRIEAAYARARYTSGANTLDFSVMQFEAPEDWAEVGMKSLGLAQYAMPAMLYYDPGMIEGTIWWWPVPSDQYDLHILVKRPLGPIVDTADTIELPDEYLRALTYALALDLVITFSLPRRPNVEMALAGALSTIKAANLRIPVAEMPTVLRGTWGWGAGHRPWAGGPVIPSPSTLPTVLPAFPGEYWNNGGLVSIS